MATICSSLKRFFIWALSGPRFYRFRPGHFRGAGHSGFTASQLYSTASYASGNLTGVGLEENDLTCWNFSNQNLTGANFTDATLTNADFAGATVASSNFSSSDLTIAQLYSTNSYASENLSGIELQYMDLAGWNFANQNLAGANLSYATVAKATFASANLTKAILISSTMTSVDFTDANLANAVFDFSTMMNINFAGANLTNASIESTLTNANFAGVNLADTDFSFAKIFDSDLRGAAGWRTYGGPFTQNTILPDGSIPSLALQANETLTIRNNPIPVTVDSTATFDPASTLQFLLDQNWTSPVGFADGLVPSLNGTLDLELAADVDPSALAGDLFQLFDWNSPLPMGDQFLTITTDPRLNWDLSDLYTTGVVSVSAVPEPASLALLAIAAGCLLLRRKRMPIRVGRVNAMRSGIALNCGQR